MKLISLHLCNFRQFYSKSPEISFSKGTLNTTIIHGNNGAGKTTLLNAFTWVLYDKFTAAFAAEDQLVNKRAMTEAPLGKPVECWVEVVFEHDNKRYQVKRLCRAYKKQDSIDYGPSDLFMLVAGEDGRWSPPPQPPEDVIGRILPESLHQYFFFDGERIEHIVRDDKKDEIAIATKELLGVEVLNRGIRHLKEAKKSLETDLRGIGNPLTKKFLQDKRKQEQEIEEMANRQKEIAASLTEKSEVKRTLNQRLLELGGAEELQTLRNQIEAQLESLREQLKQAKDNLKKEISTRGYTVLLLERIADFRSIVESLREKGELTSGIQQQFLQDLLERQKCICGEPLTLGSDRYQQVHAWMEKAGSADVEETTIRMIAQVDELDKMQPQFWQEVDQQQDNINQYRIEISKLENHLDDTKNKLRKYPDEDIQNLQNQLDETEQAISDLDRELGSTQQQIDNLKQEIERLDKEIDAQQMNEYRQVLAQRRIAATQDAIERLTEVRNRLESQFKSQLEKRVQEIFSSISFTPYLPKISDKYELTLVENTTGKEAYVAASTGENQILSLSFIGGIIDGVREWSKKNSLMMAPDSSTFPIVMDSPFGSLDQIYRRQIAKILPELANQLVVLVTKTQWRGEVETEMANYIGREYVLVYNSPKSDCQEDSIELGGVLYPLVRRSPNQFEYTEILEVEPRDF